MIKNSFSLFGIVTAINLLITTTACTQPAVEGYSDLKMAGVKGPVKRMVTIVYSLPDTAYQDDFDLFPVIVAPGRRVSSQNIGLYNQKGMCVYNDLSVQGHQGMAGQRIYTETDGNSKKIYDNWGQNICRATLTWKDDRTQIEKRFGIDGQLLEENFRSLGKDYRVDANVCKSYTANKLIQTTRQTFVYNEKGELEKTINKDEGKSGWEQITTMRILSRDRYGNLLKASTVLNEQEWMIEYQYTYYGTPEEEKEQETEKWLQPDAVHPLTGHYESGMDEAEAKVRLTLFANGRYALALIKYVGGYSDIKLEWRGRYQATKDKIHFEPDKPDSSAFLVFGRQNPAIVAGRQWAYFFDYKNASAGYFFIEGTTQEQAFDAESVLERKGKWYFKNIAVKPGHQFWIIDNHFTDQMYELNPGEHYNEWRILHNLERMGAELETPHEATIYNAKELLIGGQYIGNTKLKRTGKIVLPDLSDWSKPRKMDKFYRGDQEYHRIYPKKVSFEEPVK